MSTSRCWIGRISIPILLAAAGCSIGQRPNVLFNRMVGREGSKSAPRQTVQISNTATPELRAIETVDSVLTLPNLEATPRLLDTEIPRIFEGEISRVNDPDSGTTLPLPRLTEQPAESRNEPNLILPDQFPNDQSPPPEGDPSIKDIPDLLSTVSPHAVPGWPQEDDFNPFQQATTEQNRAASEEQNLTVSDAPREILQVGIQLDRVTDVELSKLFGPFQIEMISVLKENRDRFQSQLVEIACDRQAEVTMRSRAIFLLGAIGGEATDALPSLKRQIHSGFDPFLKVDLCEAILKIQPEDEDAIRGLVESLNDPDAEVRWIAVFALRNSVSPRTTFVIDLLREVIKTDDLKLRRMVFLTLAEFGPAASAALPEIYLAIESSDHATREVAKVSLKSIAPDRSTKPMVHP